jgi:hypothetical protein
MYKGYGTVTRCFRRTVTPCRDRYGLLLAGPLHVERLKAMEQLRDAAIGPLHVCSTIERLRDSYEILVAGPLL